MPTEEPRRVGGVTIQINGQKLSDEVMAALDEAVVEDDLGQPAMFTLRFNDPQHKLLDGALLALGAEVKISAQGAQAAAPKPLLAGEITALEPAFEQQNLVLVVRGYDRAHRLHRGRKTRTFTSQSDAEIVGQIARAQGFKPDAEGVAGQLSYLIQHNQTDMQFLHERAARSGCQIVVDDKTLRFKPADAAPPAGPELTWGATLLAFRARMSAVAQPNEVEVRGWDPAAKRALVGKATKAAAPSKPKAGADGGKAAQRAFGDAATVFVSDRPVRTQREAEKLAQAILDARSGDYLAAEGLCFGEPELRAGREVTIGGLGERLSGSYFVSATRHSYTARDGYQTQFFVNGRRSGGLLAALDDGPPRPALHGVVIGIVTNNDDPDKLGRVRVKFPWLDEQHESDWARLAAPGAGKERGLYVLPEVDDEVLLAFEHGDINRPFVLGGLFNGKDAPPLGDAVKAGKVERRTLTTRAGHRLTITDEDGKGAIELQTRAGQRARLSDEQGQTGIVLETKDGQRVHLEDKPGQATITIVTKGGQEIVLTDSPPGKITITSGGEVEIGGAGGKLRIGPAGVELQSSSMLSVKATGILSVEGSLVKIN